MIARAPVDQEFVLNLYVPVGEQAHHEIAPGSGIVGLPSGTMPGYLKVYYEGNLIGADNLNTWLERVQCAAGRLATQYPTVARSFLPEEGMQQVGTMTYAPCIGIEALDIENLEALRGYIGDEADQVQTQFNQALELREARERFKARRF